MVKILRPDDGSNTFLLNSDTQTTLSQHCLRTHKKLRTRTSWRHFNTIVGQNDWIYKV